jgi:L-ascorbate metabolism protein UlaG (beta-lactamase superfamily)
MALHRRNVIKLGAALIVALSLALSAPLLPAQSGKVEVHWLGQATFKITTPGGKVIVTDPFLTGNPKTPAEYKDLAKLGKVDLVLVTHGHGDHVGTVGRTDGSCDAVDIAKRTGAKVYGPAGLIQSMIDLGWLTAEQGVRFGKGGKVQPLGPQITITQVRAEHRS